MTFLPWLPGMVDTDGERVTRVSPSGYPREWTDAVGEARYVTNDAEAEASWGSSIPDANDPATAGCLLLIAQAKHGATLHVRADVPRRWVVYVGVTPLRIAGHTVEGASPGVALLHLLLPPDEPA